MVGYSADDYLRFSADKETIYYSEPVYACEDAYVLPTNDNSEQWGVRSDGHWTYVNCLMYSFPPQGWKIHITSTIYDAQNVLYDVAEYLFVKSISFKYLSSRTCFIQANGKYADRLESGKFITIYPSSEHIFIQLLKDLKTIVCKYDDGPYILTDKQWQNSNVFFRYGALKPRFSNEKNVPVIVTPQGDLIPDKELPLYSLPSFVDEPIYVKENNYFIELLRVSPSEIEKRLFAKTDEQGWSGPDIDLFINRIQEATACDPQIGFTLWGLVNRHEEGGAAMQYRCAIIRGWGMSSLKSSQEPVLDLMKDFCLTSNCDLSFDEINAVSGFLNEQINHEKNDISQKTLQVMDCLASQLWAKYSSTFKKSNERQWDNDPVTYSLNCWPGELAYFWIGRIRWRYNQDPDFWSGFDDSEKSVIRHFVDDEGDFSRPVWTALLTYINMLHFLDRENTESWLPNLVEKAGANFIWNVLLPYPDLNNRLISLAFYASCLDEFECLSHLDVYKRQGFFLQVFRMATYAELDEEQRARLLSKVVTAGDGVYAALFMDQVAWAFEFRLDSKDKDMVWDLWLHQFIEDRHADKGRNWGEEERVAFAKLIPLLDEHFAEGVQYLSDSFPKIADHDFTELIMIDNFDNIPLKNGKACVDFYSLLIERHGDGPAWGVQELLQKLANRFGFDEVVPLVSLARQKRMIPNTWGLPAKKEIHNDGKEGEA